MTGPRNWQAETEAELIRLARRSRGATRHDMKIALVAGSLFGAAALIAGVIAARGDTITVSVQDMATGGAIVPILSGTSIAALGVLLPSEQGGGNINALAFDANGSVWREFAVDDFFNNNVSGDTVNYIATFYGITGPSGRITLPTIQQAFEFEPGWVISTEISVNGTLLDTQTFNGLGTRFGSVSATVGSPFSITELIQFVNNAGAAAGLAGAAVLTQPDVAVPGPIAGAGLPGIIAACLALLGFACRRKRS